MALLSGTFVIAITIAITSSTSGITTPAITSTTTTATTTAIVISITTTNSTNLASTTSTTIATCATASITTTVRHLAAEYKTPFKFCGALIKLQPPVYVSDYVAKQWLEKYSGNQTLSIVLNAGRLETEYGERIRAGMPDGTTASSAAFP